VDEPEDSNTTQSHAEENLSEPAEANDLPATADLEEAKSNNPPVTSICVLQEVFKYLDGLRDFLNETLSDWTPPQLVVIGPENCGKSTILERIAMMHIFPRDSGEFYSEQFLYPIV
jgi:hypothetical protein